MLEVVCGPNYPAEAPRVKFNMPRIAMDAVGNDGTVNLNRLQPQFVWNSRMNIADVLCAVRDNMCNDTVCRLSAPLGDTSY
jgi:ubiquitin-protein ligase